MSDVTTPTEPTAPAPGAPTPRKSPSSIIVPIVLVLIVLAVAGAFAFPMMAQAREQKKLDQCRENMQKVGDGLVEYAKAHGGKLGDEIYYIDRWAQLIEKHVQFEEDPPYCAALDGYFGLGVGYALNPKFYNKPIDSPELANEPLLIETRDLMPNNQWKELSRAGRRHMRGSKYNKYYVGRGAVTEDTPKTEAPVPAPSAEPTGGPGRGAF